MLIDTLRKYASGKLALYSFCISMSIFIFMAFYSAPLVAQYAPEMQLFDILPTGYTYDYAMSLLTQLGAEGRGLYLSRQLPVDFVYPLSFGVSHGLILCWLVDKARYTSTAASYICLLPIIGCLFDYLENLGILSMIVQYPNVTETLVQVSSMLTIAKSIFIAVSYLVICVLFVKLALLKLKTGQ